MEHRSLITASNPAGECQAALADWFLGRGYFEVSRAEDRIEFGRPFRLVGLVGWRIEDLPARLEIRWAARANLAEAETMITLNYAIDARFRLWSHLDRLYFQLEVEALEHFLATSRRVDPTEELDRIRRPVAVAVLLNVVTSVALTTAAGTVLELGLVASSLISLGVALINFVSILGFADLLVSGMDDLAAFRSRLGSGPKD